MSKRVFNCFLSDPAPSADDAAPDEGDSSPDEHEQPPTKTSTGNGQATAAKQSGPNCAQEWKEYTRSDHYNVEMMSLFAQTWLTKPDLNKRAGITSLPTRQYDRKRGNIYWDWMYRHS